MLQCKICHRAAVIAPLIALFLTACQASSSTTLKEGGASSVSGAVAAATATTNVAKESAFAVRPSALLGIYMSLVLDDSSATAVHAAIQGVGTQAALQGRPNEDTMTSFYALLDELSATLKVDVPDVLNRSQDRIAALNAYVESLQNITERSELRSQAMQSDITTLKDALTEKKKNVKNVSAELKDAQKKQDYVSVGEKRDQLSKAEAEQSTVQEQLTEVQDLQKQYTSLIALAQERLDALDRNREALIAGIRVVDMPGIDSLGVLQGTQKQGRKKSNGSLRPFGGL